MKNIDGINEAAWQRAMTGRRRGARKERAVEPWGKALIERTVAASKESDRG